jgi:hypothetical protein
MFWDKVASGKLDFCSAAMIRMRKFTGVFIAKPVGYRKESTTIDRPSYFAAQK